MSQIGTNKDIPIQITITDSSGVAINIDTFDVDIEVAIFQKLENIIQKYKQSDSQVETINASLGQIRVRLDRANTEKINTLNPLYLEVVPVSTDVNYEGGIRRWDAVIIQLPNLKMSAL